MAYRIAVCDDNTVDLELNCSILERWAAMRGVELQTLTFPSAESFLFCYAEDKAFDVLLLDIEMGAMDGVTMAKAIRADNQAIQIIFVTGYSDYIAEGYEVAALHYLLKPVGEEKFFAVLDRALEKRKRDERCLTLESGGSLVRIPLYEIRYLDVHQNYVTVHGKEDYTVKRTLGEFERELDNRFYRVGRGQIVNLAYVRRITRVDIYLSDGTVLPLPRGAYEPLNRAIIERT